MCIVESIIDNANEKSDKASERTKKKSDKSREKRTNCGKKSKAARWEISMMGKCETLLFYYSEIHTRNEVRENMIRAIKFLRG